MESLYTKYRPHIWDDVLGQESVVKILKQQIVTSNIFNCMIFAGISGTGKTTLARIFANELNKGQGTPIEIDAASNNGVENVRSIINSAGERALSGEYKVYIIDEAHMLSAQAWNAFLKCIEEPPHYTLFIFCTTDPQKIPETIQNRCMRFNFTRVSSQLIKNRLNYICAQEGAFDWEEATDYISRICEGEVRKAISYLETCISYSRSLTMQNILTALGNSSYDDYFKLVNAIIDGDSSTIVQTIDRMYDEGIDLKRFVNLFLEFCFDIVKYLLTNNIKSTKIPDLYQEQLDFATKFEGPLKYYNYIVDKLLILKNMLKQDVNERVTIEIMFNQISRFV